MTDTAKKDDGGAINIVMPLAVLFLGYCLGVYHATPRVWGEIELETACDAIAAERSPSHDR